VIVTLIYSEVIRSCMWGTDTNIMHTQWR